MTNREQIQQRILTDPVAYHLHETLRRLCEITEMDPGLRDDRICDALAVIMDSYVDPAEDRGLHRAIAMVRLGDDYFHWANTNNQLRNVLTNGQREHLALWLEFHAAESGNS